MGLKPKTSKSFIPIDHWKIVLCILAGSIITITFLSQSMFYNSSFLNSNATSMHTCEKPRATKILCDFSNRRSNTCNMQGDIRIHGKSSSVISVASTNTNKESYRIKPYARKTDSVAMNAVTELTIKSSNFQKSPQCDSNYATPAIVFSVAGYTGNYFHDFTDVLVPLFLTSHHFNGEVRFLVSNFRAWWLMKYKEIFRNLSKYEIIDLDKDDRVRCFKHVVIGLNAHNDMVINASMSHNGISMVDFTKFLRHAYALPRDSPISMDRKKPRMFIVARSRTRRFMNLEQVIQMAKEVGYEVVVGEAEANVGHFARIVNGCDVMMGLHGAGLTNSVFLPSNGVLVQIVPRGLEWISKRYFDEPSRGMGLRYLEYKIGVNESTLVELYPREHVVNRSPMETFVKFGVGFANEVYLFKQNVRVDVVRLRPVLMKALELLHE